MQSTRWQNRPPGSNWGEFGPDDQRGRMNWVTREKVLQGVAEVKEGLTFVLSLPLDYPGGNKLFQHRKAPKFFHEKRGDGYNYNFRLSNVCGCFTDVVSDDGVVVGMLTAMDVVAWLAGAAV